MGSAGDALAQFSTVATRDNTTHPSIAMSPGTIDPPSSTIVELLPGVREGSLPHLRELKARLPRNFTPTNAAGILEALFANLATPTGSFESNLGLDTSTLEQLAAPMEALSSLTKVARWCIANPSTQPSLLTFGMLSNSQDAYIFSAIRALGLEGPTTSATLPTLRLGSQKQLEMYEITASFFHTISQIPNGTFEGLTSREDVIDIALTLWTSVYDDQPPIYPSGSRGLEDDLDQEDAATAVFAQVSEANARGVVAAIMDERICTPDTFVERTISRMVPLSDLKLIRRLSHFGPVTVELTSMRHVVKTTQHIMEVEPYLQGLFMQKDAFPAYIRVAATFAAKYDARTTGLMMLKWEPPETAMNRWARYMVDIVPMSRLILELTLLYSRSPTRDMKTLIAEGGVKMAAHCATFALSPHAWIMSTILGVFMGYSGFPKVLAVMRDSFEVHMTEKLQFLRSNEPVIQEMHVHAAEVKRASQYLDKAAWVHICDNAKHLVPLRETGSGEDFPQKICSRCHSVVYCSSRCQIEDWNTFHRDECSHLAKSYHQRKRTGHWYSQSNRRFQATQLWHAYEDSTEVSEFDNQIASTAIVRLPVGRFPCRGSISTSLLKEYIDNTRDAVPNYLQPRFKQILSLFVKANAPRRVAGPRSAILVDRRLALPRDSQVNILILLRPTSVYGGARGRREGSKFLLQGILAYPSKTNQFPGVPERPINGSANFQLLAEPGPIYV